MSRANPFQQFVADTARVFRRGTKLPLGVTKFSARPKPPAAAPKALIFSPHPDDECIIGGLALRLAREAQWNIINVTVTLGSQQARQAARRRELKRACATLGFGLMVPGKLGLNRINPESRRTDAKRWAAAVRIIAQILTEQPARPFLFPMLVTPIPHMLACIGW